MIDGIADTTVILHIFRRYQPSIVWIESQSKNLGVASITWMEVMVGAGSKAKQTTSKQILARFKLQYLTQADQTWAMEQLERFRLSNGVGLFDCLIASVAQRLQRPLYTHNTKDFIPMIGDLAIRPYE